MTRIGYSADELEPSDAVSALQFLQKPYRAEVLLSALRNLLHQPGGGAPLSGPRSSR